VPAGNTSEADLRARVHELSTHMESLERRVRVLESDKRGLQFAFEVARDEAAAARAGAAAFANLVSALQRLPGSGN
jgi:outer membrane murein-binding lipoprotein Lpp